MASSNQKSPTYPFVLEPLAFPYEALEPYIDAATMRLHHQKHHQSYITNLNAALKNYPELQNLSIEELLRRGNDIPAAIRQTVHEQGGGHLHHQYLWRTLKPDAAGSKPTGSLAQAITREFGSYDSFKEKYVETGVKHFGSGWVFLAVDVSGKLDVFSRPGHDNILVENKITLLINDLWEHAYYLKYQNLRADYLNVFWNIIDWTYVSRQMESLNDNIAPLPAPRALRR